MAAVATPPQRPYTPAPRPRRSGAWVTNLLIALGILLLCCAVAAGIGLAAITRDLPSIAVLDDP